MRLSNLYIPFIAYVRSLEQAKNIDARQISERLDVLIQRGMAEGMSAGFSRDHLREGFYPVAAWADERISSLGQIKITHAWQPYLLQRRYFNTSLAGQEFFEHLSSLPVGDSSVRELYVMCLSFGFVGKYNSRQNGVDLAALKLSEYRKYLHETGQLIEGGNEELLFPVSYSNKVESGKRPIMLWSYWLKPKIMLLVVVPLLIVILMAWGFDRELNQTIYALRTAIRL